ncbi:MAG TPA: aldehyde dehydrogenase family protein [Candidatus Thermoplasmatota archaeon]|nr:aldehyde dehydrogenase family protein [Candidatus Thermoplasmatota archaeon]
MSMVVSQDPATLEILAEIPATSAKDVDLAIARARAAQRAWRERRLDERLSLLLRFSTLVLRDRVALATLVSREMGKPVPEALATDVLPLLDAVKFLERHGLGALRSRKFRLDNPILLDRASRIYYEPRGVVGIVAPWNYPLAIPGAQAVFALFAGNAVVLKPSEHATLVALRFRDLMREAGLPEDLLAVVPGDGPTTGAALAAGDVDHLIFTGSVETGRAVKAACDARGKPACLELGGNDAAVVLEDADLRLAANGIVWSRFANAGQTCAAAKRAIVVERVADAFVDLVRTRAEALRVGRGIDADVDVGPLVSAEAIATLEKRVSDAVAAGARVVAGGRRATEAGPGHFYRPTILADVPPEAEVAREETFGPVLSILRAKDEEDAVRLANATRYGLTASVWTRDVAHGERVARRLEAGTVTVNDHTYTFAAMETPWAGVKDSGHGVTHGVWGLLDLVTMKHVNVSPSRRLPTFWWFPYAAGRSREWEDNLDFLYGRGATRAKPVPGILRALARLRNS